MHYTDVAPTLVVAAILEGGNHPFLRWFRAGRQGEPELVAQAVHETARVFGAELRSAVHVGWPAGYLDDERAKLGDLPEPRPDLDVAHPREALDRLAGELADPGHEAWRD